jgi:hypothetical protein
MTSSLSAWVNFHSKLSPILSGVFGSDRLGGWTRIYVVFSAGCRSICKKESSKINNQKLA